MNNIWIDALEGRLSLADALLLVARRAAALVSRR
jgi:hypothetical protein